MNRTRGFTLIELAMPLSAQIQARRVAETQKTLAEAREAIIGFARTRGATLYLPCPDTDGDGIENRSGVCDEQVGWLPWITLGTADQDAWGNRLRYEVDPAFSGNSGFSETTTLASSPVLSIPNIASEVVYVVVSHGPNGSGARNTHGITLALPTGTDELDNLDENRIYRSHEPTKKTPTSDEFDDLLVWISLSQLIPRACPDGCP